MTALTADRNTPSRSGDLVVLTVSGNDATTIYAGSLVCMTDSGQAVPGGHEDAIAAVGRAEQRVDNPEDGELTVTVRRGIFQFAAPGMTAANIGQLAFVVDDQTIGGYGPGRVMAGRIVDLDSAGAWVEVGVGGAAQTISNQPPLGGTLTGAIDGDLVDVAAAAGACRLIPPSPPPWRPS